MEGPSSYINDVPKYPPQPPGYPSIPPGNPSQPPSYTLPLQQEQPGHPFGYMPPPPPPINMSQQVHNTTTVVVQSQPQQQIHLLAPVNDNFLLSIVGCFFCWPIGVAAILKSIESRNRYGNGDHAGATKSAQNARLISWLAIACGGIIYLLIIIIAAAR